MLLLLFLATLTLPARAQNPCAAGGRPVPADDEGGISGTGLAPSIEGGVTGSGVWGEEPDEGGIGGTGISGAGHTGVVGVITGFASICVNGVEIQYGRGTVLDTAPDIDPERALALGQVVEVFAAGTGAEVWAKEIRLRHLVVGPIEAASNDAGWVQVLGQKIEIESQTRTASRDGDIPARVEDLDLGHWVRVSGFRRDERTIRATRIDPADPGYAEIDGPVTAWEKNRVEVAGTPIDARIAREAIREGRNVTISGSWDGQRLLAERIAAAPEEPFGGRVARLLVEGFPRVDRSGRRVGVGPLSLSASEVTLPADRRIRLEARRLPDGTWREHRHGPHLPVPKPQRSHDRHRRAPAEAAPPPPPPGHDDTGRDQYNAPPGADAPPARPHGSERSHGPQRPHGPERPHGPGRPHGPERPMAPDRPHVPERPEPPPLPPERPPPPPRPPDRPQPPPQMPEMPPRR